MGGLRGSCCRLTLHGCAVQSAAAACCTQHLSVALTYQRDSQRQHGSCCQLHHCRIRGEQPADVVAEHKQQQAAGTHQQRAKHGGNLHACRHTEHGDEPKLQANHTTACWQPQSGCKQHMCTTACYSCRAAEKIFKSLHSLSCCVPPALVDLRPSLVPHKCLLPHPLLAQPGRPRHGG